MAKKAGKQSATAKERKLAAAIRRSAREIWYAGLGVYSTTRDEGAKVYAALVKEGKRVEAGARKLASARIDAVRGKLTRATNEATRKAASTWSSVEKELATRVSSVASRVQKLGGAKKKRAAPRRARRTTRTRRART